MTDPKGSKDLAREEARAEMTRAQLMIQSDPAEAASMLEEAKRLAPEDLTIVGALAFVQLRLGRYVDAVANFDRIVNLSKSPDAETMASLAFAHRRLGHMEEAKVWASRALLADANSDTAREVLAEILILEKDYVGALDELAMLHNQKSNKTIARIATLRALCKLRMGDFESAMDTSSMLIENGYGNDRVQAVYDMAEAKVKEKLDATLSGMNLARRLFVRLMHKPAMHLFLAGRKESKRDMDQLRLENIEQAKHLSNAHEERAALERRADEALRAAKNDVLTGLPNRLCFDRDWRPKFTKDAHIGVVMMDLDKFKLVNDVHGHEGGDKALKKMADIGADVFRHPDGNLFRFGGEEFVALIFGDKAAIEKIVEFFRFTLEKRAAVELAREGLDLKWEDPAGSGQMVPRKLTASIGIAYWPEHGTTIEDVIKAADEAAYEAKEQGRNRIVVHGAKTSSKPKRTAGPKSAVKEAAALVAALTREDDQTGALTSDVLLAGETLKEGQP